MSSVRGGGALGVMQVEVKCGRCQVKYEEESEREVICPLCGQILPLPARRNPSVGPGNDKEERGDQQEREEGGEKRVLWQLNDDDGSKDVFSPFSYNRSLISVPGVSHPVTMNRRINQATCEFIREHFIPRDSDVWLVTYPKSGTTWVQNIISHLLFQEPNTKGGIGVGLTYEENVIWFEAQCTNDKVKEVILKSKESEADSTDVPPLVDITESSRANVNYINTLYIDDPPSSPRRRCFKSHSQLGILEPLLTSRGKVIHVARNPKDVAVSLWHHSSTKDFGYAGNFSHFLEKMFMKGQVESGGWWEYVIPFWLASKRTQHLDNSEASLDNPFSNVLTIWYEDLIESPEESISLIAQFLNIDNLSPERVKEISSLCSFNTMKSIQSSGGVVLKERKIIGNSGCGSVESPNANQIRRGGVGGWRDYFSSDQSNEFDKLHLNEVDSCIAEFERYATIVDNISSEEFLNKIKWGA